MALTPRYAVTTAVEIVKTGLSSGAIKLLGDTNQISAESNGEADGKYLLKLVETLISGIQAIEIQK